MMDDACALLPERVSDVADIFLFMAENQLVVLAVEDVRDIIVLLPALEELGDVNAGVGTVGILNFGDLAGLSPWTCTRINDRKNEDPEHTLGLTILSFSLLPVAECSLERWTPPLKRHNHSPFALPPIGCSFEPIARAHLPLSDILLAVLISYSRLAFSWARLEPSIARCKASHSSSRVYLS
jgi:hypothetical protein